MENTWFRVFCSKLFLLALLHIILSGMTTALVPESRMNYARNPPRLHALEVVEEKIYNLLMRVKVETEGGNSIAFLAEVNASEAFQTVNRYVTDYESSSLKLKDEYISTIAHNGTYPVGWNPLATLKMMRRVNNDAQIILKWLNPTVDNFKDGLGGIESFMRKNALEWPKSEDYEQVIESILKLQHIYHLRSQDLIVGRIFGVETHVKLNGYDCKDIGTFAADEEMWHLALNWLHHAVRILEEDGEFSEKIKEVKELIQEVSRLHDEEWTAQGHDQLGFITKIRDQHPNNLVSVHEKNFLAHTSETRKSPNNPLVFQELCMGNYRQTFKEQAELFCWYETKRSAYLQINPAKVELLSKDPLVVRYYNIIGEKLGNFIIASASDKLAPSEVTPGEKYELEFGLPKPLIRLSSYSSHRTSTSSTLNDLDGTAAALSRTLESISGFRLQSNTDSDYLEVNSYTFGNYFDVHTDALQQLPTHPSGGDRIATFVLYFNSVEMGGGTAFPYAGIVTEPIPASALFWYNIDSAGKSDARSHHGGCPVVLGEKWIANKWIRASNQFHSHKCWSHSKGFNFYINGQALKVIDP